MVASSEVAWYKALRVEVEDDQQQDYIEQESLLGEVSRRCEAGKEVLRCGTEKVNTRLYHSVRQGELPKQER